MKHTSISLLVTGASLSKSFLSYHINQGPTQSLLEAISNLLNVMMASNEASPICMGHAVANTGCGASNFPDSKPKLKMHHLCKNIQKAIQGMASHILALVRLSENLVTITASIPLGQHHPHPDHYCAHAAQGWTAPSSHAIPTCARQSNAH